MSNVFSLEKLTALPCFVPVESSQDSGLFVCGGGAQEGMSWEFTSIHPDWRHCIKLTYPWRLEKWSLQRNLLDIVELELEFSLDIRALANNLYQICRLFGKKEIALEVKSECPGTYWIFGGFTNAGADEVTVQPSDDGPQLYTQKSFWGMKFSLYQKDDFLILNEMNHFAVGAMPKDFLAMIPELVLAAAGFVRKDATILGTFEQKVSLKTIREAVIGRLCGHHFTASEWTEILSRIKPVVGNALGMTAVSETTLSLGYRSGIDEHNAPVSIEVLEEREMRSKYAGIDKALSEYRFGDLLAGWQRYFDDGESPYFFRRAVILAMIGRHRIDGQRLSAQLAASPDNLTFLSLRIMPYFTTELAVELLRPLSALGQALFEQTSDLAAIHVIDLIYSELFGDAWFCVDYSKALSAYTRVIDDVEGYPRILVKIIRLSRHWGEAENEIAYSFKYLKICKDESQLVYVYFRLAQLLASRDITEAILCGKKALHICPIDEKMAKYVADLLLEIGKPSEAIDILTSAIDGLALKKADEKLKIASLKLAIGNIWQHCLQRTDLAIERFKDALELLLPVVENIALLKELEDIFVSHQLAHEALVVFEKLFTANLTFNNMPEIERLKKLILVSYHAKTGSDEKLADFYRGLIEHSLLDMSEIHQVMALSEKAVFDWPRIYENFLKGRDPTDLEEKITFQRQMGDIALTYLEDKKRALDHYWRVIAQGEIDQGLFQFLFSYYQEHHIVDEYFRHLKKLTENTSKDRTRKFIEEIMRHSEYLVDDEIDSYLISLLRIDAVTPSILIERVSIYVGKDDCESAFRLALIAVDGLDDALQKVDLLWLVKGAFASSQSAGRFDYIDRVYGKLSAHGASRHDILLDAVNTLYKDPIKEFLGPYVEEVLLGGEMPAVPFSYIEETFAQRLPVIGRYYEIIIFGQANIPAAPAIVLKFLSIIEELDIYREREVDLLKMASLSGWLDFPRLERLRDLLIPSRQVDDYEKALTAQMTFCPEETGPILERLLRLAIHFYDQVKGESTKLFRVLDKLENLLKNDLSVMFEIAEYAYKYHEYFKAKRMVFHCLDNEFFWENSVAVNQVFVWMVNEWDEKSIIANIVRNKLQVKIKARDWTAADKIAAYLEKFELYDLKTAFMAFEAAAERGDEARMERTWLEASLKVEEIDVLNSFLSDSEKLIERTGRIPFFRKLLSKDLPVEKSPFLQVVAEEYKLKLATKYLGGEVTEQSAYDILNAHFSAHPDDPRAWMPLYFLFRGRDESAKLVNLLRQILPRLEEDEQALAQFPVTLESLRDEVIKYDDQYAMPRTPANSHKKLIGDSHGSLDMSSSVPVSSSVASGALYESVLGEATQYLAENSLPPAPKIPLENWREVVMAWQSLHGMTDSLMEIPFDDDLEKHIALQVYAVISGEYTALKRWKYQVWRDAEKFTYPRISKERIAGIDMSPASRIPRFKEFTALTPYLSSQSTQNFSVLGLARKLGIKAEDVISSRRTVNWSDRFFEKTLIKHYATQLNQMHFVIFHMKGLGRDLFYDIKYRALYFDADYFGKMPPSYIFHRIMLHLRAVTAGYHVWLFSDLKQGIMPFIEKARSIMQSSLGSTIKSAVGIGLSPRDMVADSKDRERLRRFFQEKKDVGIPDIEALIHGMWRHLYEWQAVETLDLIGLCETILGVDFSTLKAKEIGLASSTHTEIKELLSFIIQLKFNSETKGPSSL